jgi:hypothetical protein
MNGVRTTSLQRSVLVFQRERTFANKLVILILPERNVVNMREISISLLSGNFGKKLRFCFEHMISYQR